VADRPVCIGHKKTLLLEGVPRVPRNSTTGGAYFEKPQGRGRRVHALRGLPSFPTDGNTNPQEQKNASKISINLSVINSSTA